MPEEKTIPMRMLRDIMDMTEKKGGSMHDAYAIANQYGFTVTDEKANSPLDTCARGKN